MVARVKIFPCFLLQRLKHLTPRQAELNLQALTDEYREKRVQLEQTAFRMQMEEEERVSNSADKEEYRLTNSTSKEE